VKTYSDKDAPGRHPDHLAAGQGLRQLVAAGTTTAPRFYIEPWLLTAWRSANPGVPHSAERTSPNGVLRVRDAFDVYAEKDPYGFKFGIGRASVSYFDTLHTDPVNYWHI
jgi:hypothetical protein